MNSYNASDFIFYVDQVPHVAYLKNDYVQKVDEISNWKIVLSCGIDYSMDHSYPCFDIKSNFYLSKDWKRKSNLDILIK